MTATVAFSVVGVPVGQGSKRAFARKGGGVVMTEGGSAEATKRHKSWRADVADAARAVAPPEPFDGPVMVRLVFRFLPVASDPYRTRHVSAPDVDKLCRSVLDALKVARVVVDDSRVYCLHARKDYCGPGETPGVDVHVQDSAPIEAVDRLAKKALAAERRRTAKGAA